MDIYYEHKARKIVDEKGNEHTYDQAMEGINDGTFDNWNWSFIRLMENKGDMEAVEKYYTENS